MVRPRIITVLSWLFIVSGVVGLVAGAVLTQVDEAIAVLRANEVPVGISVGMTMVSSLVYLVSGVGMLKAMNGSRHLLLGLAMVSVLFGVIYSPYKLAMIPGAFFMALMVWPLYRPLANRFFTHQLTQDDIDFITQPAPQSSIGVTRKVFAILFYVVSGFLIYTLCFTAFVDAGGYSLLPDMLKAVIVPFLVCHGVALFLFRTPARWLSSGITLLVGPSFTAFILFIALYYPMPEAYAEFDLKSQLGHFSTGLPLLAVFWILGGVQLWVGILRMRAHKLTQTQR